MDFLKKLSNIGDILKRVANGEGSNSRNQSYSSSSVDDRLKRESLKQKQSDIKHKNVVANMKIWKEKVNIYLTDKNYN